jgi:hypothetical protein
MGDIKIFRIESGKWLCAGGADAIWNMQWQTTADGKAKDVTERRACGRQRCLFPEKLSDLS